MNMTISVVIPTFQSGSFILSTLESVTRQTRLPDELVIVDDCSYDNTISIVSDWIKIAPFPVTVIKLAQNSGGPARPLNSGIEAATSDLIAPLDHDDEMHPDKLRQQAIAFREVKDLKFCFHRCSPITNCRRLIIDDYNAKCDTWLNNTAKINIAPNLYVISNLDAYSGLIHRNYARSCSSMMYKKIVWTQLGGISERFKAACDYEFIQRITARWDIAFIDISLVNWMRRPASFTFRVGDSHGMREQWKILGRFKGSLLCKQGNIDLAARRSQCYRDLRQLASYLTREGILREALAVRWSLLTGQPSLAALFGVSQAAFRLGSRKLGRIIGIE